MAQGPFMEVLTIDESATVVSGLRQTLASLHKRKGEQSYISLPLLGIPLFGPRLHGASMSLPPVPWSRREILAPSGVHGDLGLV